jgi:hypothetical protein
MDLFSSAHTFGTFSRTDAVQGQTGWNYSNGDGVMFYPGTDKVFPASSYNVDGPFASLRLKYWRRGLQDHDYLTMAAAVDSNAVKNIVNTIIPKVVWEVGVADTNDPTWVLSNISWSTDPDVWEAARLQLATMLNASAVRKIKPSAAQAVSSFYTVDPAGRELIITYILPADQAGSVAISVYAASGQMMDKVTMEKNPAGAHMARFSTRLYSPGIYFYRIEGQGVQQTGKLVLVR